MSDDRPKNKPEPGGKTYGMLHRSPDPDCPLCQLWGIPWEDDDPETWGKQHIYAEELWKEWNPKDKSGRWVNNVIAKAASFDPPVIVEAQTVKDHFGRKHRIEQPMLTDRINHEEALFEVQSLPDDYREIIELIFRLKCLTTSQITEVFFKPDKPVGKTAQNAATRILNDLAANWNLYRYMASSEDLKRKNAIPNINRMATWFLGKLSVPYIQDKYQIHQKFYPHYLNRARDCDVNNLAHDLRAVEVVISMFKELNPLEDGGYLTKGKKVVSEIAGNVEVWPLRYNWYGPGINLLAQGYIEPVSGKGKIILPDGFVSIAVAGSDKKMPDSQLPFFIEYDNDSKTIGEVVDQLLAYHFMGLDGASKRRFPDLNVDKYIPPVLIVFSRKNRSKAVLKRFQERAVELGIQSGAPILFVAEEDWKKGPFQTEEVFSAWDQELTGKLFLDHLIAGSYRLIKSEQLEPEQVLTLDPEAAPARFEKTKDRQDKDEYFNELDFEKEVEPVDKSDREYLNDSNREPQGIKEKKQTFEDYFSDQKEDQGVKDSPQPESLSDAEEDVLDDDLKILLSDEDDQEEFETDNSTKEGFTEDVSKEETLDEIEDANEEKNFQEDLKKEEFGDHIEEDIPTLNDLDKPEGPGFDELVKDSVEDDYLDDEITGNQTEPPTFSNLEPDLPEPDPNFKEELINEEENDFNDLEEGNLNEEPLSSGPIVSKNDLPSKDLSGLDTEEPAYQENTFIDKTGASNDFPALEESLGGQELDIQAEPDFDLTPTPIETPRKLDQGPITINPFDPADPLAPNNLVGFPNSPTYNPNLEEPPLNEQTTDFSNLPEDSPIRKAAQNQLQNEPPKQPLVAGGIAEEDLRSLVEKATSRQDIPSRQEQPVDQTENIQAPEISPPPQEQPNQKTMADQIVQEPVAEPPVQEPPVQEPAAPPIQEPVAEPPVQEPATPPIQEPVAEPPVQEPAAPPIQEPVAEPPVQEPVIEPPVQEQPSPRPGEGSEIDQRLAQQEAQRRARRRRRRKGSG